MKICFIFLQVKFGLKIKPYKYLPWSSIPPSRIGIVSDFVIILNIYIFYEYASYINYGTGKKYGVFRREVGGFMQLSVSI